MPTQSSKEKHLINVLWQRGRAIWLHRQWRRLILIGTAILSLGLLFAGLVRGWHELMSYAWQFDWAPLPLGSVVYMLALLCSISGWMVIMRALRVNLTWQQNAKFYLYSWMARRLPTPMPYLTSRVLLYEEAGVPKRVTSLGLVWENVLLIASSALLVLLMLPIVPIVSDHIPRWSVLIAVAVSMLFVVHPALLTVGSNWVLRRFGKAPLESGLRPTATASALLIYMCSWTSGGLILFFLIRTLYPIEIAMLPFVVQCWALSGLVSYITFFAPLSFGVREITLSYLLSLAAIPLSVAIAIVLLVRVWNMVNELFWAFIIYRL
jgi:hypothetical protein